MGILRLPSLAGKFAILTPLWIMLRSFGIHITVFPCPPRELLQKRDRVVTWIYGFIYLKKKEETERPGRSLYPTCKNSTMQQSIFHTYLKNFLWNPGFLLLKYRPVSVPGVVQRIRITRYTWIKQSRCHHYHLTNTHCMRNWENKGTLTELIYLFRCNNCRRRRLQCWQLLQTKMKIWIDGIRNWYVYVPVCIYLYPINKNHTNIYAAITNHLRSMAGPDNYHLKHMQTLHHRYHPIHEPKMTWTAQPHRRRLQFFWY